MVNAAAPIDIPNRALFKAAEVCEIVKLQPYVLRSWEAEFPGLGVAKAAGSPRVYRRADVEQVVRIKHLLLVDGLTLAGARRKLEEEAAPVLTDGPGPAMDELLAAAACARAADGHQARSAIDPGFAREPRRDPRVSPVAARGAAAGAYGDRRSRQSGATQARPHAVAISPPHLIYYLVPPQALTACTATLASGRSVAWLSRLTGGQEIGSSNLPVPTIFTSR